MKRILSLLLILALVVSMTACVPQSPQTTLPSTQSTTAPQPTVPVASTPPATEETDPLLAEDGYYNSKEDVALYIHLYGCLPRNYVTKSYASDVLKCSTSRVEDYWPGGAIGGDVFGNREGLLPKKAGRTWTECDINTWGRYARGAERIVFSNDGLVYYTSDHYRSFELLYGDPNS